MGENTDNQVKHSYIWATALVAVSLTIGTYGFYTWQVVNRDNNLVEVKRIESQVKK